MRIKDIGTNSLENSPVDTMERQQHLQPSTHNITVEQKFLQRLTHRLALQWQTITAGIGRQSTDRQTQTDLFCQQQINRRSVTKANTLRTLKRRFRPLVRPESGEFQPEKVDSIKSINLCKSIDVPPGNKAITRAIAIQP